ncbi:AGAP006579-PB-like protein [Anopheles sinensis]|uniref:AGAP006579-PB-like protein n=1 Tax=Anopheles sinensis TaxID=74873 RepID=A0A084WMR3_ANOSI|nr:AGAP006579-PB-like protein [Anopheles sinensis]
MDCCSSSSYMDYRHHSMNSNFCYPYSPSMLRSASSYPLAGPGMPGSARYGSTGDYRSMALGYGGASGGYDGYDKYYGGGGVGGGGGGGYHHPAASAYPSGYYGNYPSPAYREYGGYGGGHYYHQSQSPYARSGGPSAYSGGSSSGSGYLPYGARHYPSSSPLGHPFGRESYYHAQNSRDPLHHQPQYSSFASYGSLPPYHRNGATPEHPSIGAKSHQHHQQQPYPVHQNFPGNQHERAIAGVESSNGVSTSQSGDSPSSASVFNAPSGYSPSPTDYTLPSSYSASGDSPTQHPLGPSSDGGASSTENGSGEHRPSSGTPAPPSQQPMLSNATGMCTHQSISRTREFGSRFENFLLQPSARVENLILSLTHTYAQH